FLEKRKEHFRWFTCWQTDRNLGELLLKPFCPCILLLKCRASQQKSPEDFFGVSIRTCPGSHCNYGRSHRARQLHVAGADGNKTNVHQPPDTVIHAARLITHKSDLRNRFTHPRQEFRAKIEIL